MGLQRAKFCGRLLKTITCDLLNVTVIAGITKSEKCHVTLVLYPLPQRVKLQPN